MLLGICLLIPCEVPIGEASLQAGVAITSASKDSGGMYLAVVHTYSTVFSITWNMKVY